MAATTATDVVYGQLWADYAQENLMTHGTILAAGMVEENTSPELIGRGDYTNEPKLKPLTETGDDEQILPDTDVSLASQEGYAEYGVVVRRAKGWNEEDLVQIISGISPFASSEAQFAEYVARQIERQFVALTNGVFGTALASSHVLDETGTPFSFTMVADAAGLMGEAMQTIDRITCHSSMLTSWVKQGIVTYVDAAAFGENVLRNGVRAIPVVMDKRVVVNDVLCAPTGSDYPTYLSGGQPYRLSWQRRIRLENDRDIRKAAGTNFWVASWHIAPHVKGVSYSASSIPSTPTNPTPAQLATANKWERVATNAEDIKLVKIVSALGA